MDGDRRRQTEEVRKMSRKRCIICGNPVHGNGLCSKHYQRQRFHGDPNIILTVQNKGLLCSIEACKKSAFTKGFCRQHYDSITVYGRVDLIRREKGTGSIHSGYVFITVNGEQVREHIYLAEKALGRKLPEGAVVHHMNEDGTDNHTPFNLVICPDRAYHNLLHTRMRQLSGVPAVRRRKSITEHAIDIDL